MMVIARAPVRISLAGGGTDLPAYYRRFTGTVVSTAINAYVYTILTPGPPDRLEITSAQAGDGNPCLPRAITRRFGIHAGLTIFLASQVPPGTGLGSSSSLGVSVATALAAWHGMALSRAEIAELACRAEMEDLGMPIGKQDQYIAAYGGLNEITFTAGDVTVRPLTLPPDTHIALQRRLLLFFTGTSRRSSSILQHQRHATERQDPAVIERLHAIKSLAFDLRDALCAGKLDEVGEILHRSWDRKRQLAPNLTNARIDEWYAAARRAGAIGGKIAGAGGGGFLLLYCPEEHQATVTRTLSAMGLRRFDFAFESEGSRILLATRQNMPAVHRNVSTDTPLACERETAGIPCAQFADVC